MAAGDRSDARADRVVQALGGTLILTGFVFKIPLLVPAVGLHAALVAGAGPGADPLRIAWTHLVTPRLRSADGGIDPRVVRRQHGIIAADRKSTRLNSSH